MSKKYSLLTEKDVTLKLSGVPDDVELDDLGIELVTGDDEEEAPDDEGDDEGGDDEGDDDVAEEDLEAELAELFGEDDDVDEIEPNPSPMDEEGDDVAEFYEFMETDDDDTTEEGDDDVTEFYEFAEGDDDTTEEGDDDMDEVVEIDENMLRQELRRMKKLFEGDGVSDFGGGSVEQKDIYKTQMNKHDALKARVVKEARKNRTLNRQLKAHKHALNQLRKQLSEMNLFNAKLLYANKLLQNENLTKYQKLNVIKSLDKAQSLREAKLLYKGLLESIGDPGKKSLNESSKRRVRGSASRPTKSGRSNDTQTDRWAQLAGLKS
jgi:hypothetical protein